MADRKRLGKDEWRGEGQVVPLEMRARRTDRNHAEGVAAFRKYGCWVRDLHDVGKGLPDLLIAVPPNWTLALVEVKDGEKPPSQRKLTDAQEKLHAECPAVIWIVESEDDVFHTITYIRQSEYERGGD